MMTNRPASTALVNRGDLAMCLSATRNIVASPQNLSNRGLPPIPITHGESACCRRMSGLEGKQRSSVSGDWREEGLSGCEFKVLVIVIILY